MSSFINTKTANRLKDSSERAEAAGTLTAEQLAVIYANKWFKILVPKQYGGLAMSLPEALRLEEYLARIDGSLGWTVTLCAGANFFAGYIDPALAQQVFCNETVCLGGSGAATGSAEVLADGYRVNGYWKYATGAPHLTHFTANCKLVQNGQLLTNENGQAVIRSFIFTKDEVILHHTWNPMGLIATASYDFEIKNRIVPKERMFLIDVKHSNFDDPVYQYPFLQFAETTIAVNSLGMAEHFIDEVCQLFKSKLEMGEINEEQYARLQKQLDFANHFLQKNREPFYALVDQSWEQLVTNKTIASALLERISFLSKGIAKAARELVTEIYPLCGISATQKGTVINRIFRDMFTGSQHSLLVS